MGDLYTSILFCLGSICWQCLGIASYSQHVHKLGVQIWMAWFPNMSAYSIAAEQWRNGAYITLLYYALLPAIIYNMIYIYYIHIWPDMYIVNDL